MTFNSLVLTVAQFRALGSGALPFSARVTLADSGAALASLAQTELAALAGKGVGRIDARDNQLSLSVAQYLALRTVSLTAGDVVTLADTGAALAALSPAQIRDLAGDGIDRIDATNDVLALSVAQYRALGAVQLVGSDHVVLRDSGTTLGGLSLAEIGALDGRGIDALDATSGGLTLSVAEYRALGMVALTASGVVTLRDSAAALRSLSINELTALAGKGVNVLLAYDGAISLNVAQYLALGPVRLQADKATLADSGAALAGLSVAEIGGLAVHGIDRVHATDDALVLSADQVLALDGVALASDDTAVQRDSGTSLAAE